MDTSLSHITSLQYEVIRQSYYCCLFAYKYICTLDEHTALHFEVRSKTKFDAVFFVEVNFNEIRHLDHNGATRTLRNSDIETMVPG